MKKYWANVSVGELGVKYVTLNKGFSLRLDLVALD